MATNTVPVIFNVLSVINEWYQIKRRINEWCRIARVGALEFHQPTNVTNQPAKMATHAVCRLQQPVQNPISDNTNVLWNSPSLGKNYSYRLPLVL